jgi:hypothetical protein
VAGDVSGLMHPNTRSLRACLGIEIIQNTTRYMALVPDRSKPFGGIDRVVWPATPIAALASVLQRA